MPVFEKPPLETLPPVRERWTPLYLEHGRLEVDDSSVKWIDADGRIMRLPVSSLSVLMLGPGTTITHAAVKTCAQCGTPICWVGEDGMRFYASGIETTHDAARANLQALLASAEETRDMVARKMMEERFPDLNIDSHSVDELRGYEGQRVRELYERLGSKYGVTWRGRSYSMSNWDLSDGINRAISTANAALYALTASVITSMGYLPQIGFIHSCGMMSFVYDIADIYKPTTSLPAAFESVASGEGDADGTLSRLKAHLEKQKVLQRMPAKLSELIRK